MPLATQQRLTFFFFFRLRVSIQFCPACKLLFFSPCPPIFHPFFFSSFSIAASPLFNRGFSLFLPLHRHFYFGVSDFPELRMAPPETDQEFFLFSLSVPRLRYVPPSFLLLLFVVYVSFWGPHTGVSLLALSQ